MSRPEGSINKIVKMNIAKVVAKIKNGEPLSPDTYRYYSQHTNSILKEVNKGRKTKGVLNATR